MTDGDARRARDAFQRARNRYREVVAGKSTPPSELTDEEAGMPTPTYKLTDEEVRAKGVAVLEKQLADHEKQLADPQIIEAFATIDKIKRALDHLSARYPEAAKGGWQCEHTPPISY